MIDAVGGVAHGVAEVVKYTMGIVGGLLMVFGVGLRIVAEVAGLLYWLFALAFFVTGFGLVWLTFWLFGESL